MIVATAFGVPSAKVIAVARRAARAPAVLAKVALVDGSAHTRVALSASALPVVVAPARVGDVVAVRSTLALSTTRGAANVPRVVAGPPAKPGPALRVVRTPVMLVARNRIV